MSDHYEALGVPRNATEQDIRARFRALAYLHPDQHPDDPTARARFARITEAYACLSSAEARAQYDDRLSSAGPAVSARDNADNAHEADAVHEGHVTDAVEMAVEIVGDVQRLDAHAGLRALDHLASKEGRQKIRSVWGSIRGLWSSPQRG